MAIAGVQITGDKELIRAFDKLRFGLQKRVKKNAARKGARVLVSPMKKAAPVRSGALKKSLTAQSVTVKGQPWVDVFPKRGTMTKGNYRMEAVAAILSYGRRPGRKGNRAWGAIEPHTFPVQQTVAAHEDRARQVMLSEFEKEVRRAQLSQ